MDLNQGFFFRFGGNHLWRFWKSMFYQLEMEEIICDGSRNMRFINRKWIWTLGMFVFLKVQRIHSVTNDV